jgi:hypothetical protein
MHGCEGRSGLDLDRRATIGYTPVLDRDRIDPLSPTPSNDVSSDGQNGHALQRRYTMSLGVGRYLDFHTFRDGIRTGSPLSDRGMEWGVVAFFDLLRPLGPTSIVVDRTGKPTVLVDGPNRRAGIRIEEVRTTAIGRLVVRVSVVVEQVQRRWWFTSTVLASASPHRVTLYESRPVEFRRRAIDLVASVAALLNGTPIPDHASSSNKGRSD